MIDFGEECDDGNLIDDAACNHLCGVPGELVWESEPFDVSGNSSTTSTLDLLVTDEREVLVAWHQEDHGLRVRRYDAEGNEMWTTETGDPDDLYFTFANALVLIRSDESTLILHNGTTVNGVYQNNPYAGIVSPTGELGEFIGFDHTLKLSSIDQLSDDTIIGVGNPFSVRHLGPDLEDLGESVPLTHYSWVVAGPEGAFAVMGLAASPNDRYLSWVNSFDEGLEWTFYVDYQVDPFSMTYMAPDSFGRIAVLGRHSVTDHFRVSLRSTDDGAVINSYEHQQMPSAGHRLWADPFGSFIVGGYLGQNDTNAGWLLVKLSADLGLAWQHSGPIGGESRIRRATTDDDGYVYAVIETYPTFKLVKYSP